MSWIGMEPAPVVFGKRTFPKGGTMRKTLAVLGGALLTLCFVTGCSTEKRTVYRQTETVVPQTPPRVIEEQHTTIERATPPPEEEQTIIRRRSTETREED